MIRISQMQLDHNKIREIYKKLIVPEVKKRIHGFAERETTYLENSDSSVQDACRITVSFLQRHDLYGSDLTPETVLKYLLGGKTNPQGCLEGRILLFWQCAADVCADRLRSGGVPMEHLKKEEIAALSKWEGLQKKALEQPDQQERRKLLRDALNERTCRLFSPAAEKDIRDWQTGARDMGDEELAAIGLSPDVTKTLTQALDFLEGIFAYDRILNRKLTAGTPRHQLMCAMDVPVCPYCNRQYITLYQETEETAEETEKKPKKRRKKDDPVKKTTADLDHFYIKDRYPYLSLSLYNFIPSCQICNSRFKGSTDFYVYPHVYPYREEFGDAVRFSANLDGYRSGGKGTIGLVNSSGSEAVKNSISTFSLEEVYQSHAAYVQELQTKSERYNQETIDTLLDQYRDLFKDKRDILNDIYGQYLDPSKIYLRPLGKLTMDILDESYRGKVDWNGT